MNQTIRSINKSDSKSKKKQLIKSQSVSIITNSNILPKLELLDNLDNEFEESWEIKPDTSNIFISESIKTEIITEPILTELNNTESISIKAIIVESTLIETKVDKPISNLEKFLNISKSTSAIPNSNILSGITNQLVSNQNIETIENVEEIITQIKENGIKTITDFKTRGIEVSGINENLIIKNWSDMKYIDCNPNQRYIDDLITSIINYGFESPRPIQETTIGQIAKGGDIIVQATAGNGKTAAFGIGAALSINPRLFKTQVLILSPTQILTDQTMTVIKNLTLNTGIIVHCYRGGLLQQSHREIPHIIVGCPGRINDMIKRDRINLSHLRTVVLDEGDELLRQGFREQIKNIVETMIETVQICLFSATLPKGILELCTRFMRNPAYVILPENQVITELVTQWYVKCPTIYDKDGCIVDAIEQNKKETIIIFFNSCTRLQKVSQILSEYKEPINHLCIHSKIDSIDRVTAISDFAAGKCKVLLASDMASRGLDIPSITLVINYDIPCAVETYIHRIGRSGRGDCLGNSITLISTEEDRNKMTFIVQVHGIPIKALKTIKMESKPVTK
jgi:superfamily II DNA/RNA helicase